jgi:hypothetical protein
MRDNDVFSDVLGRAADAPRLRLLVDLPGRGRPFLEAARGFLRSPECRARFLP